MGNSYNRKVQFVSCPQGKRPGVWWIIFEATDGTIRSWQEDSGRNQRIRAGFHVAATEQETPAYISNAGIRVRYYIDQMGNLPSSRRKDLRYAWLMNGPPHSSAIKNTSAFDYEHRANKEEIDLSMSRPLLFIAQLPFMSPRPHMSLMIVCSHPSTLNERNYLPNILLVVVA